MFDAIAYTIEHTIESRKDAHLFTIKSACENEIRILYRSATSSNVIVESIVEGEFADEYTRVFASLQEAFEHVGADLAECFD